jgi:indole-3-glycerol phosphate synthase
MGFLSEFIAELRLELDARPLDDVALREEAGVAPPPRDLAAALRKRALPDAPALIAEVKRASPSAGTIAGDADPVASAIAYAQNGAAAISVLTEPVHFGGSLEDLRAVRGAVDVPILRKDFLVTPAQALQARAAGADAILVITAAVDDGELRAMVRAAEQLGLGVLVEAHSDEDLDRALAMDVEVIGVNARDLETLEVDLDLALERLRRIPRDRLAVLESGISDRAHVVAAARAGASAILVGEALMRADDPGAALRRLIA